MNLFDSFEHKTDLMQRKYCLHKSKKRCKLSHEMASNWFYHNFAGRFLKKWIRFLWRVQQVCNANIIYCSKWIQFDDIFLVHANWDLCIEFSVVFRLNRFCGEGHNRTQVILILLCLHHCNIANKLAYHALDYDSGDIW